MTERRCETCEWWERSMAFDDEGRAIPIDFGGCHYDPPRRVSPAGAEEPDDPDAYSHPGTYNDDWCSHWTKREEPAGASGSTEDEISRAIEANRAAADYLRNA